MTVSSRVQFARTAADLVESDLSVALVYAEISGQFFGEVERRNPDRVVNVGIREQLLVNVGAGMALTGLRPIVHTFGSFLVERAFEQFKLGFGHQDVGGVLVGSGGSFDIAGGGRTHQVPGDVALVDTLPGVAIHAPGTAQEVDAVLRATVAGSGLHYVRVVEQANTVSFPHAPGRFHVVRRGAGPTVVALGPVLDDVLTATEGLDVTVLYVTSVAPFDADALAREIADALDDVSVTPFLEGTLTPMLTSALAARPSRFTSIGVGNDVLRGYGTVGDHDRARGLDERGIRDRIGRIIDR